MDCYKNAASERPSPINTAMSHTTRIPSVLTVAVGSILLLHPVAAKSAAEREVYKEVIVPILRGKCYQCHADAAVNPSGRKKIKAKLDLTTIDLIKKGGDEGPAAVAGDLEESIMIERINLPHDDDDHMPPEDKPQLDEHELKVLKWWIKASLPAGKSMKDAGAPDDILAAAEKVPSDEEVKKALVKMFAAAEQNVAKLAADRKALEGAIAEVSEQFPNAIGFVSQQDSDLTFTAVSMRKDFKDEHLTKLAPVSGGLVDVNLGATSITDAGMANLSKMPKLRKLWLNGTGITDAGLDSIKALNALEYLNLYGTQVTDEGLRKLAGLKNLKKLYLWQTKVTSGAVEEFKKSAKDCDVNMGIKIE